MTLTFDSHFDWLLILLSWHYYESFWDFLHGMGFVYLPFFFIFLKNSYEPIIKDGFLKGSAVSLRQVEWACFTAFLVIMCVAQPYIKIETGAMAFSNTEIPTERPMQRVAKTLPETIRVPLWWYIIQNLNERFHSIVSKAIPVLEEPRALRSLFFLTSIADQPISKELNQFKQQCYLPSMAQYDGDLFPSIVDPLLLEGSAYYLYFKAKQGIPGFLFNKKTDWFLKQANENVIFGAPNCHDWWLDSDSGLLQRLLKLLPESLMEYYNNLETEHSRVRFINFLLKTNNITPFQKLWITLPSLLYQSLKQFNTIILALIFITLPMILLIGCFQIKSVLRASVIVLLLFIFPILWQLIQLMDNMLLNAFYEREGASAVFDRSPQLFVVDTLMLILYFIFPILGFKLRNRLIN